ncbi:hypothetical protein SADUNF_Sadunf05G0060400 [Salix dunnii]|uniref:Uncharacterized protein n=1 Tax=Salix dunnii TaxID=1413687 RepID=A0A835K7A7_9ROSI|nr:hypothetical protein SADUNF_Sadunf05G0060400 [Salix dunnii]
MAIPPYVSFLPFGIPALFSPADYLFSSSPLPCQLSDLPEIYKEEDEPAQISDRKRHVPINAAQFINLIHYTRNR